MKSIILFLSFISFILFTFQSCKKTKSVPREEPEKIDSFWLKDIHQYEGLYIVKDSIKDEYTDNWEFGSSDTSLRTYLVKYLNDTIIITFNPEAFNTTDTLTLDLLNTEGYYYVDEFSSYRFNNDSLFVKGDFEIPPYVSGKFIKRATRYLGVK